MHGTELNNLAADIMRLSRSRGEPDWLNEWRLKAATMYDSERTPLSASALLLGLDLLLSQAERAIPRTTTPATERTLSDSNAVFQKLRAQLAERGVIIEEISQAALDYSELLQPHLGMIAPNANDAYSVVNSMLWTDGWFVYVPKGVQVELPLQIPSNGSGEAAGERMLIVCEEESRLEILDGCVAPKHTSWPLLLSVVEIAVKRGAHCRYTSIQNWTRKVSRHDTMCARPGADSLMEWNVLRLGGESVDVIPCTYLIGPGARTETWAASYAASPEERTMGGRAIHCAPQTRSHIIHKMVRNGGSGSRDRSAVEIPKGCRGAATHVECDTLLLSDDTSANMKPQFEVDDPSAEVHQSTRSVKADADELLRLQSREEALVAQIEDFLKSFTNRLPKEYAVEVNHWIELAMEGSVG